ncbi:hypothetical protein NDU88_006771 [Pleurodeles waltl]|uniref:Uncharacterized protein n=1 Tax=Pleurodeles waltl TaxID=8319 RepID=A0AAV7RP05_PLEWA|nr:hypothetical protein NDU88_006771 [Pleurodeles waltl]
MDKMGILAAAHQQGDVEYNANRISFYPDYGVTTQKMRRLFVKMKRKLRNCGKAYALLPLARLQLDLQGKRHYFKLAEKAMQFL